MPAQVPCWLIQPFNPRYLMGAGDMEVTSVAP